MTEHLQPPHVTQTAHQPPKTFAVLALGTGSAALFSAVIAIAYIPLVVIASVVFGLAAVALGIMALLAKHRPAAASTIGLVAGALALVVSLSLFAVIQITDQTWSGEQPETPTSGVTGTSPLNMASGGAVLGEGMLPLETKPLEPGSTPVPHQVDRGNDPVDIMLYVDYRCPHCSVFELANSATLQAAVESGQATLEIRPLTFMDRFSSGSAYSSRAANLFACTVQEQPEHAWQIHNMLLNPEIQPADQGAGPSDEFLLSAADIAVGGEGDPSDSSSPLTQELQTCALDGVFMPFVQSMNDWTFDNPVPGATEPSLEVEGTPLAVVGGDVFTGDVQNAQEFRTFLEQQGVIFE